VGGGDSADRKLAKEFSSDVLCRSQFSWQLLLSALNLGVANIGRT
jgi:hypothetical protein